MPDSPVRPVAERFRCRWNGDLLVSPFLGQSFTKADATALAAAFIHALKIGEGELTPHFEEHGRLDDEDQEQAEEAAALAKPPAPPAAGGASPSEMQALLARLAVLEAALSKQPQPNP